MVVSFYAAGLVMRAPVGVLFEATMIGFGTLVIGFILFARNVIGGGDAKLLAATVLWVGLPGLALFLFHVALSGAVLAMFLIAFRKAPALPFYAQAPWLLRLHQEPKDIPYAVAICAGGLLSFQQTLYFQLVFGG